jgi:hypothetical protein
VGVALSRACNQRDAHTDTPCPIPTAHWHCAQCGSVVQTEDGLCAHHGSANHSEWHLENRIWCDGLHRGVWPARLKPEDREPYIESFW